LLKISYVVKLKNEKTKNKDPSKVQDKKKFKLGD